MSKVFEFVKTLLVENMQIDESKINMDANIIASP